MMNPQNELTLWVGATRYYLGRMSYAVSTFCDLLCVEWPKLSPETCHIIQCDVEETFERDDKARARGEIAWLPLGHDYDRRFWETVRKLWEQQLRADLSAVPVSNLDERGNLVYIGSDPPIEPPYPGDSHS
jgi:hypothetical protein